jgi:hypothetical protein
MDQPRANEQIRENKPNPGARPTNPRGNTSAAGGGPDARQADPSGQSASSGGAFGKEGHSNRRTSVDPTGQGIAGDQQRSALDDDEPHTQVGDPHRAINQQSKES